MTRKGKQEPTGDRTAGDRATGDRAAGDRIAGAPSATDRGAADRAAGDRGRFAYDQLNRTIHERARLGIMACLAAHADGLLFPDLRRLCDLTDGNLNRHLQVLDEAGLVEVLKEGQGRGSQTLCKLTRRGRDELASYVAALEKVVADALASQQAGNGDTAKGRAAPRPGWSAG
jgi:DNA-binding transcriptional ArsR family regulator